jgi:hypothetical protein
MKEFQSHRGRADRNENQEPDRLAVGLFEATRHEIKGKRLSSHLSIEKNKTGGTVLHFHWAGSSMEPR